MEAIRAVLKSFALNDRFKLRVRALFASEAR